MHPIEHLAHPPSGPKKSFTPNLSILRAIPPVGKVTQIQAQIFYSMLKHYDPIRRARIKNGFMEGFPLRLSQTVPQIVKQMRTANRFLLPKNGKEALNRPQVVNLKLSTELTANRMIGPFDPRAVIEPFVSSPINLTPKKTPGKFRLIHNLSYPYGGVSVNSFIPDEQAAVSYASFDTAIALIQQVGQGAILTKTDIQHAYKIIPVRPVDVLALGIHWDGQLYFDCTLPMGCRSGCAIFEEFSTALQFIAEEKGCGPMCHILDDFFFVSHPDDQPERKFRIFKFDICGPVGVVLLEEKTESGTRLIFMGIELDSLAMQARLPEDKVEKCRAAINEALNKKSLTVQSLEHLLGLLSFACNVVSPGRPFLRRMYKHLCGVDRTKRHHFVHLTVGARSDLRVWKHFLGAFNGITMFKKDWQSSEVLHLYTDSSGNTGFGLVFGEKFAAGVWPETWKAFNIALLEFYPILLAFKLFGPEIKNSKVCLHTDNQAVMNIINNQTSKDPYIMVMVRDYVLTLLTHNIEVKAVYIPTKLNTLADSLSRQQWDLFRREAPWAKDPEDIPTHLLPQNYKLTSEAF